MQNFFYGWYLKCEADNQTIAIIPAIHQCGAKRTCSIQIITDENTYSVTFPAWNFYRQSKNRNILKASDSDSGQAIIIGENIFCEKGMKLSINTPELILEGKLLFRDLVPLKYDIMGPFVWIPFMECRHSVYSMHHIVEGEVFLNGKKYVFHKGKGYWEGDKGSSFPREYLWTQCFFEGGSLMLSVAEIPFAGGNFTGVLGVVWWQGKEYRLATYLGAKVTWLGNGSVRIVQRDMMLEAKLLGWKALAQVDKKGLQAPVCGEMNRIIQEHVACRASYRFVKDKEICLDFVTERAGFEYEYKH